MDIRKISIGQITKVAMHYLIGQEVLGGKYFIHLIQYDNEETCKNMVQKNDEVVYGKNFHLLCQ